MVRSSIILLLLSWLSYGDIYSQHNLNVKRTFFETNHQVYFANFSDSGNYIISTGSDNNIILWNSQTGIIYRTLVGLKKRPNAAVFSEKHNLVVSGGEDMVATVWDPTSLVIVSTFKGHTGKIKTLDISPDGKMLATGSSDKSIRIWDIEQNRLIYELKEHKKDVNALQFSPDGSKLISGGADKRLILWNVLNGGILAISDEPRGWIRDVEYCADGQKIASCGDDNMIYIWDATNLGKINMLSGHEDWVQCIDFSPNGQYLASGGHDQRIILWDLNTGKELNQSNRQDQIVLAVAINQKRPDLLSATLLSQNIKVWALSGFDNSRWEQGSTVNQNYNLASGQASNESQSESMGSSTIEIFSPAFVQGRTLVQEPEVLIIGRVSDQAGIKYFLINKNVVQPSGAGIFEFRMNLAEKENQVEFTAINSQGIETKKRLVIDYSSDEWITGSPVLPEIERGRYYALIIGINLYDDLNINDLDKPIDDATALYNVLLEKYTFDSNRITFLKDPSRSELIVALDKLGKILSSDDNLLIFYAGHGHWDEKGNIGYWLPSDATIDNTANWFRNSTLRDFVGSIQTRHTLLIADACFSGAIFKTRAAITEASSGIQKLYELPSRSAMTSGILQEVPDESIFVQYLIKRLRENNEKFLPSESLFSSFKTAVMNNSPNVPQFGVIQNVGDEGGDFIFISR